MPTSATPSSSAFSPASVAPSCSDLLADKAARRRLGRSARDEVCRQHDWRVVVPGYPQVYRAVGADE
jgi:glycosyltransferase involved in cell wall biosynthesis